jgi:hypothetical protein
MSAIATIITYVECRLSAPTTTSLGAVGMVAVSSLADLRIARDRLAHLDAWLASRGLPPDWTGDLDCWRWIYRDSRNGRMTHSAITTDAKMSSRLVKSLRRAGYIIRWDRATPEQRTAALALESSL